ncbi:hypothetical protein [Methylobacterium nodulans]|uniref:hypothetical protein n=1 Tax=Methylobacterium nodulans TaxID=114616 RepID=UPI0018DDE37B|nr:hypothetical protein [Methylobacterium nodulans]
MAARVRFLRDFDFWPRPSVVIAHRKGEEKRLPQVQVEAAVAAGAAEIIDGDQEPRQAAAEAAGAAGQGARRGRAGHRAGGR